jgi:hypothetical protein
MSALPPVINYGRLERLRPVEASSVQLNLNTFCVLLLVVCALYMYKRSVTVNQQREQFYISDTLMPVGKYPYA